MSRPSVKLVLSDIDGTILPHGQRVVSERMRAAMHAAMDAGMRVGPASGRGIAHVVPTFGGDDACMATALTNEASVLLLDEPTAFLDVDNRIMVLSTLRSLARESGTTVMFSTHDISDGAKYSDAEISLLKH